MIASSFDEAEYVALSTCATELSWLRRLLLELVHQSVCVNDIVIPAAATKIDISAAIAMTKNSDSTKFTKHIYLRFRHVCQLLSSNVILFQKLLTNCKVADVLTKIPAQKSRYRSLAPFALHGTETSTWPMVRPQTKEFLKDGVDDFRI